jgi:hypothetical protein
MLPRLGLVLAALLTAIATALAVAPATGVPVQDDPGQQTRQRVPQTSDGVRGERALPLPGGQRAEDTWTTLQTYPIVPGVTFEQFNLTGARGVTRGQLLRIDPATPGVGFDLVSGRNVASRHVVPDMMDANAVAGVNGDFFDIRDTEAPLGVGVDKQRGILNGVESGWNSAFWVDAGGAPHIGELYADAVVRQRPRLDITTVNSPSVRSGEIGLYTKEWGALRKTRVVDGQKRGIRMVIVRKGKVFANRTKFPGHLRVTDKVLVGRGSGAGQLARLRPGQRITTDISVTEQPQVAITGNLFLVRDGVRLPQDDRDLHPRTAIGIDRDTGQVLLLVMDGRQSFSRGSTMLEMAKLFQRLGAEDALNLDGGGSSILVARQADGSLGVLNSPSDGHPRPVANGLQVTYDVPPPPATPTTPSPSPSPTVPPAP